MKLLILTNNPSRASFRLRILDHLPYLQKQGIEPFVYGLPKNSLERWRLFQSSGRYDAILVHRKCFHLLDAMIFQHYAPKRIFDFDDAIMYSSSEPHKDTTSHYRIFRRTAKMMDVMIAGNEYLANHAQMFCKQVFVLPTGLDTKVFEQKQAQKSKDKIRLVWIGSKSTLPYLSHLQGSLEYIGRKYKNVVLRIIADQFVDIPGIPVEKCPWSLETESSDLLSCDIGLSPLPLDRFTQGKCGFKMLQYFAAGLPVIASPVGVNEKFLKESSAGLLASTSEEWKTSLEKMIDGIEIYRTWGEKGKKYVQSFERTNLSSQLCEILLHS